MIDLKNSNEKNTNSENTASNRKKRNAAQEANAKRFLGILIAIIVVFVTIVCVIVSKRNETLLAQQKIDEATKNNPTQNSAMQTTPAGESAPATTQATTEAPTYVDVAVEDIGTVDEPTIVEIDEEKWHLTLLKVGYKLPEDYKPDLVYVCESAERLNIKVAESYEKMYKAALKEGLLLTPCSGYRSYETQERNFNRKVDFYIAQGYAETDAHKKAAETVMPAGSSEHNMGIAIDIISVENWVEETEEFKWLQKNAADYGFIMRYPKNKQSITNVVYEPWHWRYVGVEAAKEMKEKGLTLEEYLGVTAE